MYFFYFSFTEDQGKSEQRSQNKEIGAWIVFDREKNAITSAFAAQFSFLTWLMIISAQKISKSELKTYNIVLVRF